MVEPEKMVNGNITSLIHFILELHNLHRLHHHDHTTSLIHFILEPHTPHTLGPHDHATSVIHFILEPHNPHRLHPIHANLSSTCRLCGLCGSKIKWMREVVMVM